MDTDKARASKKRYREKNRDLINANKRQKTAEQREKANANKRKWEIENPEAHALQRVRQRIKQMNLAHAGSLKLHYAITLDSFNAISALQNHVCGICNTHVPTAKTKRLFVDHDHGTGALRALLCHRCNSGLGYFKDNLFLMRRAIAYLEGFTNAASVEDWESRVRGVLESLPKEGGKSSGTTDVDKTYRDGETRCFDSATAAREGLGIGEPGQGQDPARCNVAEPGVRASMGGRD